MHQGRDAHPGQGVPLDPGWVQEGDGVETRKGEEAQCQKNIILGYISSPWQLLGNRTGSELLSTK